MADVAAETGVSISTVSRALKNHPGISGETRERVRQAAERLDYRPDPFISNLVSALATRRRGEGAPEIGTIAYIERKKERNVFDESLFRGAQEQALLRGYRLECFSPGPGRMTGRRLSQVLYHRGIRGVCLAPLPGRPGHMTLEWERFCSVAIGYSMLRPSIHRVSPHHFHNLLLALRTLRRLGYRRVAICFDEDTSKRVSDAFEAAVLLFQQRYGKLDFPMLIFRREPVAQKRLTFERWVRRVRPDAVLGPWPCEGWLRMIGISVPEKVGFAALGVEAGGPECSGISEKAEEVGRVTVDLVIHQIQANEVGLSRNPRVAMVEGEWAPGLTAPPRMGA